MKRLLLLLGFAAMLAPAVLPAEAEDAAEEAEINAFEDTLEEAFTSNKPEVIRESMTPDHLSVAPFLDGPKTVDEQMGFVDDFKDYTLTVVGEPSIVFLSSDVALRTYVAELTGTFRGKPLPARVFFSETVVKRDGKWMEAFFQMTALAP